MKTYSRRHGREAKTATSIVTFRLQKQHQATYPTAMELPPKWALELLYRSRFVELFVSSMSSRSMYEKCAVLTQPVFTSTYHVPSKLRLDLDDRSRVVLEARRLEFRNHLALLEPPQVPAFLLGRARAHARGYVAELLARLDSSQSCLRVSSSAHKICAARQISSPEVAPIIEDIMSGRPEHGRHRLTEVLRAAATGEGMGARTESRRDAGSA